MGYLAVLNTLSQHSIRPNTRSDISAHSPSPEMSGESTGLRHFIQRLSDNGRLVRVKKPTEWRFEIGRMTRQSRSPLLFENIKEYPGQQVFTNGLSDIDSIALALGLERGHSRKSLLAEARHRMASLVKPKIVPTGPVLENIVSGSELNLLQLPVPHWSYKDRGRYLGTWHINVTKDPETGSRNVGVYRMQMLGPTQATVSASPGSHLARQFAKAEKEGRPLPMAVAIGVSEAVVIAAAAAYPDGMDEYDLAGALQQAPVPLISCQTAPLEIPANSEIVIDPTRRACAGRTLLRLHWHA